MSKKPVSEDPLTGNMVNGKRETEKRKMFSNLILFSKFIFNFEVFKKKKNLIADVF